ncbi:MAG: C-GCAxxG-C-C family protein [Chloroflexota bacterium]
MLTVGEHLWGTVDRSMVRLATAFGGGVGGSQQELCGALSGGVMVIGLHLAPSHPSENEEPMRQAVTRYRERFVSEIGPSQCAALRDGRYGSEEEGKEPCSALVQRAVHILLQVLDGASDER